MKRFSPIITGFLLLACAEFNDHNLLETSLNDSLVWDMVSLKGLDDALLAKNQADIVEQINFKYTDLGDFEVRAGVTKDPNRRWALLIHFKACNGGAASYKIRSGKLRYKSHIQTSMLCGRLIESEAGKQVINDTPALIDDLFRKLAPKVRDYDVSSDGLTFTLLDENNGHLGLFTRREAAE